MSKDRVEKKRSKTDELKSDLAQRYLDIAAVMIIVINANQEVALINRQGCEILGYSEEEIIGKNWFDHFLPQKKIDEVKKVFDRLMTEEIEPVEHHENTVLCKNGEKKTIVWHNTLLKDKKGTVTGTLSSGLDITERKQVEEKLRESERQYRLLFDSANEGIGVIQDNRFCLVNPKLVELSGYSEEELLSRPVFDFTLPEDRPAMVDRLSRRIAGEDVTDDYDFRIIAKDNSIRWTNANAVLIEWGGKPATLNFLTDITERRKAEKMARVQQEQLLQADKMISLGILVSGVAHEINNPNNSITLNARFLEKSWQSILPILEEYYKEDHYLQIGGIPYKRFRENTPFLFSGILDSSKRIKHIVDELKEFSRKDTGETNVSVDLNAVVESAAGLLNNIIKKSTHHFEITLEKQLPLILGDYRRLEQVIINLVQNACQALTSPAQHIVVSTHHDRERRQVIVEVKDEGAGIKKKHLKYITEPFFTTRRSSGGTGLGLSVSSRIIDDHGGTLRFITETGKGTTAEIRFPVFKKKEKGGKKSNG